MTEIEKATFICAVYSVVAAIPCGRVASYSLVARLAGRPGYQRLVGRLLRDAPPADALPCHCVVNSLGRPVPGWAEQRSRLEAEGVTFKPNGSVDMRRWAWEVMEEAL